MGCGIQRSIALILRGEFVEAFFMYPAIYPLVLLFSLLILNQFISIKYANKSIIILAILTVATIIVSYIIKMTTN
ncbi:DUF2752 domain-containing protein [Dokdonia sp. LLG6352-1]